MEFKYRKTQRKPARWEKKSSSLLEKDESDIQ